MTTTFTIGASCGMCAVVRSLPTSSVSTAPFWQCDGSSFAGL
ncbi:hypothetical protein [Curvibacter sp. CHRR-16]|nr:hypothetical protein [Curvibacter sp. CHRR-16]